MEAMTDNITDQMRACAAGWESWGSEPNPMALLREGADVIDAERALTDDLAAKLKRLRDLAAFWFGDVDELVDVDGSLARYREARGR
jgi:hypothetical protein